MSRFLLWLCMLPSRLWASMGADVAQLRMLLWVRLLLDNRRPVQMGRNSGKPSNYRIWITTIVSVFVGLLYVIPLIAFKDLIAGWTIYYTAFGFLYVFTLITDLGHVLLDTREKYIVQTRPVGDRTILLARLLHLFSYLVRTALPMSLGGWAAAIYYSGWKGALWFPVTLFLLLSMIVFAVNVFYIALLRLVKPGKFSAVLSYFQVVFAIILFAGYQFLPRLLGSGEPAKLNLADYSIVRFFPAYWLGSTWGWTGIPLALGGAWLTGLLAFALPVICLVILVRVLAPQFARRLALLDSGNEAQQVAETPHVEASPKKALGARLASIFTRTGPAEAGFLLSWALTTRSRSFRMRMLTSLAYLPVYFVFLISSSRDSVGETLRDLPNTNKFLMLLYMVSFVVMQSVSFLAMSDAYKAAWIYRTTPVEAPGALVLGGIMAVWVKYILPFFGAIGLVVLGVWGWHTLPDILLAGVNIMAFGLISLYLGNFYLPFSIPEKAEANRGARNIIRVFFAFLIPLALGALHYLALKMLWLKLLFLALAAIFLWLVWTSLKEKTWAFMNRNYRNLN